MLADSPRRRTRARRSLETLMLVLAIASAPGVGVDALQRPHCVQHGATTLHAGHAMAAEPGPPAGESRAWTTPATHDCPHCPASECARVSPCAGSTSSAVSPMIADLLGLSWHRFAQNAVRDRPDSATPPLDTPPPQLIA